MLPQMVAIGIVYQEATTLHNVPLSPDVAKVTIERVRVPDACVPLPSPKRKHEVPIDDPIASLTVIAR